MTRLTLFLLISILSSCAITPDKKNLDDLAKETLENNKGNILFPEDRKMMELGKVTDDFIIEFSSGPTENPEKRTTTKYQLREIKDDEIYFDVYSNGKLIENFGGMYKQGKLFHARGSNKYHSFDPYDGCEFVIGECIFEGIRDKKVKMNTTFQNGVWISRYSDPGRSKRDITMIAIYDKSGLILYERKIALSPTFPTDSISLRTK